MSASVKFISGVKSIVSGCFDVLRLFSIDNLRLAVEGCDWQMDFGPIEGKAGETKELTVMPHCLFRAEKILATDSVDPAGTGTRVSNVRVGSKLQSPCCTPGGGTLTVFYSNNAFGNGIHWDLCRPDRTITMFVYFIKDCKFDATVFGKAVI